MSISWVTRSSDEIELLDQCAQRNLKRQRNGERWIEEVGWSAPPSKSVARCPLSVVADLAANSERVFQVMRPRRFSVI